MSSLKSCVTNSSARQLIDPKAQQRCPKNPAPDTATSLPVVAWLSCPPVPRGRTLRAVNSPPGLPSRSLQTVLELETRDVSRHPLSLVTTPVCPCRCIRVSPWASWDGRTPALSHPVLWGGQVGPGHPSWASGRTRSRLLCPNAVSLRAGSDLAVRGRQGLCAPLSLRLLTHGFLPVTPQRLP